jgi:hypothetical protein
MPHDADVLITNAPIFVGIRNHTQHFKTALAKRMPGLKLELVRVQVANRPLPTPVPDHVRSDIVSFVLSHSFLPSTGGCDGLPSDLIMLPIRFGFPHVLLAVVAAGGGLGVPGTEVLHFEQRLIQALPHLAGLDAGLDKAIKALVAALDLQPEGFLFKGDEWNSLYDLFECLRSYREERCGFLPREQPLKTVVRVQANAKARACHKQLADAGGDLAKLAGKLQLEAEAGPEPVAADDGDLRADVDQQRVAPVRLECEDAEDGEWVRLSWRNGLTVIHSASAHFWFAACVALVLGGVGR